MAEREAMIEVLQNAPPPEQPAEEETDEMVITEGDVATVDLSEEGEVTDG